MKHIAPLLLLAACGSGSPEVDVDLVGTFEIELIDPYTSVLGVVYDAPSPSAIVWEEAAGAGDCVLVTPRIPFCATPCGSDAVCVEDNTCQPYATKQDVGGVTVTGLGDAFTMEPIAGNYQPPASVDLAYPPFGEGDPVALDSSVFSLTATGIAPLELTSTDLVLERDVALSLSWSPGAAAIDIYLDISHHGGSRGAITCTSADDGALDIDATLITQLLDLGAAGFPTIIVTRRATGADGDIELRIDSSVESPVTVPGIQSCTEDTDCPDGQTCRDDLTCG